MTPKTNTAGSPFEADVGNASTPSDFFATPTTLDFSSPVPNPSSPASQSINTTNRITSRSPWRHSLSSMSNDRQRRSSRLSPTVEKQIKKRFADPRWKMDPLRHYHLRTKTYPFISKITYEMRKTKSWRMRIEEFQDEKQKKNSNWNQLVKHIYPTCTTIPKPYNDFDEIQMILLKHGQSDEGDPSYLGCLARVLERCSSDIGFKDSIIAELYGIEQSADSVDPTSPDLSANMRTPLSWASPIVEIDHQGQTDLKSFTDDNEDLSSEIWSPTNGTPPIDGTITFDCGINSDFTLFPTDEIVSSDTSIFDPFNFNASGSSSSSGTPPSYLFDVEDLRNVQVGAAFITNTNHPVQLLYPKIKVIGLDGITHDFLDHGNMCQYDPDFGCQTFESWMGSQFKQFNIDRHDFIAVLNGDRIRIGSFASLRQHYPSFLASPSLQYVAELKLSIIEKESPTINGHYDWQIRPSMMSAYPAFWAQWFME